MHIYIYIYIYIYIACMCLIMRTNSGRDAAFFRKCVCVCSITFEGNGTVVSKIRVSVTQI
jgi:hypothetical protein